ncbi:unnamed protein product [Phytophthora fragariaefolia]|uniref:Unnamed protein product n=1 Tax=Phytophthora fragariaefolia TaxID=1490495 RepID=A0A9W6Y8A7_9STRA|nr:unnamed protein product [Phytophthora fragariaefolia]
MSSSRNRVRRTQEEDEEEYGRWDRRFVEEEKLQCNLARFALPSNRDDSDDDLATPLYKLQSPLISQSKSP